MFQILKDGEVKEFGNPHALLQDENSLFNEMIKVSGASEAEALKSMAKEV